MIGESLKGIRVRTDHSQPIWVFFFYLNWRKKIIGNCVLFCLADVDECVSQPCLNGATCLNDINLFQCQCASGWTGDTCQIGKHGLISYTYSAPVSIPSDAHGPWKEICVSSEKQRWTVGFQSLFELMIIWHVWILRGRMFQSSGPVREFCGNMVWISWFE